MKIFIFTTKNNIDKGIVKLNELVGDNQIKQLAKMGFSIELTDGTSYRLVVASDNSRGLRIDKAYVDRNVSNEILSYIIEPSLAGSILPVEEQIEFF